MTTFKIELTEQDIILIGKILPEHPYKLVAPILDKFNQQIQEQLKEKENADS